MQRLRLLAISVSHKHEIHSYKLRKSRFCSHCFWCVVVFIINFTFGLDLLAMGIVDVPICMFEWFVTNGPLVRFVVGLGDVTKLTAAPVVASPVSVTSTFVLSTCNRFRNVTNSLLRLFKRCCKWTASFVDEASVNWGEKNKCGKLLLWNDNDLNEKKKRRKFEMVDHCDKCHYNK